MSIVTKARVKATGEIIRVSRSTGIVTEDKQHVYNWWEVETLDSFDEHYWTRLEHQAAIGAMQGLMSILPQIGGIEGRSKQTEVIDIATSVAHALVEKYKKEEMKEIKNFLRRVDKMLDEERKVRYDTQDSVIVFGGDINQSAQIIHGQPIVLSGAIANEMLKDEATESIVLKAVEMYKGVKNKKSYGN